MTLLTREERLQQQKGKIIVTTYSQKRDCVLYLQDPTLTYNPKFKWTQFESNAKTFNTELEAKQYLKEQHIVNYNLKVSA